jgi:hypothetical protein
MNNDSQCSYVFVVSFDDSGVPHASIASGKNSAEAVENYYSEMDAYCSPNYDEDHIEDFLVKTYRLPKDFPDESVDKLQDMDGEELSYEILELSSQNKKIICSNVRVILRNKEMHFSDE